MKELLELKRIRKQKKPEFVRQDAHKKPRLRWKWRKPKGSDSKMRLKLKGYRRSVRPGYGSPKAVKGLTTEGLHQVLISDLNALNIIDKSKQGIIIRKNVGVRKKVDIIKKAEELGLRILNIKNPGAYLKEVEDKRKQKKEAMKKRKEEKEKKKKEKDKKKPKELADKIEKIEEKTDKEKKDEEKKEKDKLLIKREA